MNIRPCDMFQIHLDGEMFAEFAVPCSVLTNSLVVIPFHWFRFSGFVCCVHSRSLLFSAWLRRFSMGAVCAFALDCEELDASGLLRWLPSVRTSAILSVDAFFVYTSDSPLSLANLVFKRDSSARSIKKCAIVWIIDQECTRCAYMMCDNTRETSLVLPVDILIFDQAASFSASWCLSIKVNFLDVTLHLSSSTVVNFNPPRIDLPVSA